MDVKIFRESLTLTQQEMAALLGVTQPSWNYYETGKREIPAYIQREIEFFQALSKRSQQRFIHRATTTMRLHRTPKGRVVRTHAKGELWICLK